MELGDRVRQERLRRKMSVRACAALGGISNTWWGKFEDGIQPLSEGIAEAVSRAFDWPADWPEISQRDEVAELRERLATLERQVDVLTRAQAPLIRRAVKDAADALTPSRPAKRAAQ